jgi:hypothetical protein
MYHMMLKHNITNRMKVFENRVAMRIFGPKREEMTGKSKCVPLLN